jgi:hypothetical protein
LRELLLPARERKILPEKLFEISTKRLGNHFAVLEEAAKRGKIATGRDIAAKPPTKIEGMPTRGAPTYRKKLVFQLPKNADAAAEALARLQNTKRVDGGVYGIELYKLLSSNFRLAASKDKKELRNISLEALAAGKMLYFDLLSAFRK